MQGGPAAVFVHDDLAALKLRFIAPRDAAQFPDGAMFFQPAKVRPEDRARGAVLRGVEEEGGIADGDIVGIEQQHLGEAGMDEGVGFHLPAAEPPDRVLLAQLQRIDAADAERGGEGAHPSGVSSRRPRCQSSMGKVQPRCRSILIATQAHGKYFAPPPQMTMPRPRNRRAGQAGGRAAA